MRECEYNRTHWLWLAKLLERSRLFRSYSQFSGGMKPKLGDAEKEELKRLLSEKDTWTLREVRILIKEKLNVEYSEMQVWRILTSWNMHHANLMYLTKDVLMQKIY